MSLNPYSRKSYSKVRPKSVDYRGRHRHNISSDTSIFQQRPVKIEVNSNLKQPVLSEEELIFLFKARCKDLQFSVNLAQFERFKRYIKKDSFNGKLKMINLNLSKNSILALFEILRTNRQVKRLYLSKNKLLNDGAIVVSKLIKTNDNIIHLDLSSNGITHTGLQHISQAILDNNTIVSLNLSSYEMAQRNKLGPKGAKMLKRVLKCSPYLQFLNVSWTSLCNDGSKILLEGLKDNKTLLSLSLKGNEITHEISHELTEALISSALEYLDLSDNNLGNAGINEFCIALRYESWKMSILKLK